MLGDDEGPRVGQIEHLPGAVADARVLIQARAAPAQAIARRRLAATRAVQPEPALELRQPRLQRRILGLKGRDQREQVFQRRRTRQFASHPMLESEPASAVERIFSSNSAAA